MTPEKLVALIDRYGSTIDAWPDAGGREEAQALLAGSEAARRLLRRARGLERCLQSPEMPGAVGDEAACEHLIALTLARARYTPQLPPPLSVRLRAGWERLAATADGWWCYGLPATVALVLGIVVGGASVDTFGGRQTAVGVEGLISVTHTTEPLAL